MMYAKVINNEIYPNYTIAAIRKELTNVSLPNDPSHEYLALYNFYPQVSAALPELNEFQWFGHPEYSFNQETNQVLVSFPLYERTLEETKQIVLDLAKNLRKSRENSGVEVAPGIIVHSTREDQSVIQGILLSFQIGLISGSIRFKTATGFIDADQAMISQIATAIAQHVQYGFVQESIVTDLVTQAATISDLVEIKNNLQTYFA